MSESRKILYVDDEDINLKLFSLSFKKEFEVYTAYSAEEGLEIIEKTPDLKVILSDLRMPGMDGLMFIKEVKKRHPSRICMLLSGFVDSEAILEGFNKDLIFRYLTKPWKKESLFEALEEAFNKN